MLHRWKCPGGRGGGAESAEVPSGDAWFTRLRSASEGRRTREDVNCVYAPEYVNSGIVRPQNLGRRTEGFPDGAKSAEDQSCDRSLRGPSIEEPDNGDAERPREQPEFDIVDLARAALDLFYSVATDIPPDRRGTTGKLILREIARIAKSRHRATDRVAVGVRSRFVRLFDHRTRCRPKVYGIILPLRDDMSSLFHSAK